MGTTWVQLEQMGGKVGGVYGYMDGPNHLVGSNHMVNWNRKFANGHVLIGTE